ncbi:MAG: family 20 glycosylhydrolase [Phycisphaerales bacterium]|nr:family 20 glycosylhydrolase [Phycisphaerales bacterium]
MLPDPAAIDPLLIPAPRRLDRRPGHASLPPGTGPDSLRPLIASPDPSAGPLPPWLTLRAGGAACGMKPTALQGYSLRIGESGPVAIESPTTAGLRHGLATLRQLLRQYGPRPPALEIIDAPAFPTRGVMLDVSRDRIPTMPEFRAIIDQLADLKFNHLQLYTEHTFAYAGHEDIWRGWSSLTPEEVVELDSYCSLRGIDLAANQNCFGHLAVWLRHPRYASLAETHGDWKFYHWTRSGPFSLCPGDPGSIALVEDWLEQLLPCFSSGLCNINADETFDVGQGRSKEAVEQRGHAAVYFEFIGKVCNAVRRHGKRPMFWADIALTLEKQGHPESIALIPADLLCLAWGYEPEAQFGHWCDLLRRAGRESWVCPGTSSWRSTTGRTAERRANLDRAARDGLHHDATGYLITDWGDVGHTQQWPVSLHGIAEAAHAAWTGAVASADSRAVFHRAESLHTLDDRSLTLASWLDRLGEVDAPIRSAWATSPEGRPVRLHNATALFNDFRLPWREQPRPGSVADWSDAADRLEALASAMPPGLPAFTREELDHTIDVARTSIARAIARRRADAPTSADRAALGESIHRIMTGHARLWARRSRPGGLDNSQKHYQKVLDELSSS